MMEESREDPPAYCAVAISDTTHIIKEEKEAKPLSVPVAASPFEDIDSRRIFTLKVLSIFVLQMFAICLIIVPVFCYSPSMPAGALVCAVLLYFAALTAMVYSDTHVEHKTVYNHVILVIYPLLVAFVIVSLLAFCYGWRDRFAFMGMISVSWTCYIAAALSDLFFTIFSIGSKRDFGLAARVSVATLAFIVTYFGLLFIIIFNDFNAYGAFGCAVFLYIHFLYVLHDVHAMTGRNYRVQMTPDDVVRAAVNLQIDFVYIIEKLVLKCATELK